MKDSNSQDYFVYEVPPKDFNPKVEVAGCFCEFEDKILYIKRHQYSPQGDTWGIPAGKLEKGENPWNAVIREISEEVGLDLKKEDLRNMGKLYVRLPEIDYIFHLFAFKFNRLPKTQLKLDEHVEERWLTPKEVLKLDLIKGGVEALKFYLKGLELEAHAFGYGLRSIFRNLFNSF